MTTTPRSPRLDVKVRRQVWREEEHPRDRKGRFIETGAEVRWLAGLVGRVIAHVGGGLIEVEKPDGQHVLVHRNYLTVVARPNGKAPTDRQDANPAAMPETSASTDAVEADVPDPQAVPNVDPVARSVNLHDALDAHDRPLAALIRQAAADYLDALGNGTPNDEAEERDGLLALIDQAEAEHGDWEDVREAAQVLRDAATAEPTIPDRAEQPTEHRVPKAVARAAADSADIATEQGRDPGYVVDGSVITVTDRAAAVAVLGEAKEDQEHLASTARQDHRRDYANATAGFIGDLIGDIEGGTTGSVAPGAPREQTDIERIGMVTDARDPQVQAEAAERENIREVLRGVDRSIAASEGFDPQWGPANYARGAVSVTDGETIRTVEGTIRTDGAGTTVRVLTDRGRDEDYPSGQVLGVRLDEPATATERQAAAAEAPVADPEPSGIPDEVVMALGADAAVATIVEKPSIGTTDYWEATIPGTPWARYVYIARLDDGRLGTGVSRAEASADARSRGAVTPEAPAVTPEAPAVTEPVRDRLPSIDFGLAYSPDTAEQPNVVAAKAWDGWESLPTVDFRPADQRLLATEATLSAKPIDRVVRGGEPLREGYDPYILIQQDGTAVVIDGHHRVAMYAGLNRDVMPSKVYDERVRGPITEAPSAAAAPAVPAADEPVVLPDMPEPVAYNVYEAPDLGPENRDYTAQPDKVLIDSLIGKRVEVQFYDEETDNPGEAVVGRFVSAFEDADHEGHFEFSPEGEGYSYPLDDASLIYRITRMPEPGDPDQLDLFDTDAKPVYDGGNETGAPDGQVRGDRGATLAGEPAGGVRDDREQGTVLREPVGGGDGRDRGTAPGAGRPGRPDGDVRGEGVAADGGEAPGRGEGDPRGADADAPGAGGAGGPGDAGRPDGVPLGEGGTGGADGRGEPGLAPPVNTGWGQPYLDSPAYETEDGPVWLFRRGQEAAFFGEEGGRYGPIQSNIAGAVAYAHDQGWSEPTTVSDVLAEAARIAAEADGTDLDAPEVTPERAADPLTLARDARFLDDEPLNEALDAAEPGPWRDALQAEAIRRRAEVERPVLPARFEDLEPGTRIRVGFEEFASNGIFERVQNQWGTTRVLYTDEDGHTQSFIPTANERPRPAAPRDPAIRRLLRRFPGEVNVGTWRGIPDSTDDGVVRISGGRDEDHPTVTGTMRATVNGWVGSIDQDRSARYNAPEDPAPALASVTGDDPQSVLDALYDAVHGEGRADLTRHELAMGRALPPEVAPTWSSMPRGSLIEHPSEPGKMVRFLYYQPMYDWMRRGRSDDAVGVVHFEDPTDEARNEEGDLPEQTADIVPGQGPRPAAPLLGAGAEDPDGITDGDDSEQPEANPDLIPILPRTAPRFQPTSMDDLAPAGKMAKLDANLAALRLMRTLRNEDRPATPEEQRILARWAGWGGLPEVFEPDPDRYPRFRERAAEVKELLTPGEWREGARSTLNAHYTDANVVKAMWEAMSNLGFDGGRVIEPGSGSGTFIGFAPPNAEMIGVELDSTTAAISKYLYPHAMIRNEGYQHTNFPDGSVDASIGNVPYGKTKPVDPLHNAHRASIHNHFIQKSLDFTRPGGVMVMLTSRYTLDSQDASARKRMFESADLIGAVRLPNGSHKRAAETDVIEDILIFRKRLPGEEPGDDSWLTSTKRGLNGWDLPLNNYFDAHPEHALGTITAGKGQFGGEVRVEGDVDVPDLRKVLRDITDKARADGRGATPSPVRDDVLIGPGSNRYTGHIQVEDDGSFTIADQGASRPFNVPVSQREEVRDLAGIRDALQALLDAETASLEPTEAMEQARAELNRRYDAYVAKYGPLSRFRYSKSGSRQRPGALRTFSKDPKYAVIRALENYTPPRSDSTDPNDFGTASKLPVFRERAVAPRTVRTSASDADEAITLCLDMHGEIRIPVIAQLLETDEDDARRQLTGLAFEVPPLTEEEKATAENAWDALQENPEAASLADLDIVSDDSLSTEGKWVIAAEYLSDNTRKKLAHAKAAAEKDDRFLPHVEALKGVIPKDLGPEEIDARLGAAWIPASDVEDFIRDLIKPPRWSQRKSDKVSVVSSGGGIWRVQAPKTPQATDEWGTDKRPAGVLIQSLLEQRAIKVTGKGMSAQEQFDATKEAQAKADAIQERFKEWLWEDSDRAHRLLARYNAQYNALTLRKFNGQGRSFPGMSEDWRRKVHPHIKDAVERVLNSKSTLLAHVVGAGKTAVMVMAAQELKRLGLARKPAIIVPNHLLNKTAEEWLEIYPNARILTAGKGMTAEDRREFVARAAVGDWDAVIMTQSAFQGIPMSPAQMESYIERETALMRAQVEEAREAAKGEGKNSNAVKSVKRMEAALLSYENRLRERLEKIKDQGISFEQTGIDYLMVDEAHMYSNLMTNSNIESASTSGSIKATDLHMKMEYLRETSKSGRVATFATGTPIRNTITQAYIMARYMGPELLAEAGIHSFDQWAATFGTIVSSTELKPEGSGYRSKARFARFRNIPEFLRMFHTFADVKMKEDLNLPTPNLVTGKAQVVSVPRTKTQADYIKQIGERAEDIRSGAVDPTEDNMLKISSDGRKAALSMAMLENPVTGKPYPYEPGKLDAAADRIAAIYARDKDKVYTDPKTGKADPLPGSLQIAFLDMGTPKTDAKGGDDDDTEARAINASETDFVAYDKLKELLVAQGVPADKIRFIHEAKTDVAKAEMFQAAKSGEIAVLLGSSEMMGTGANMQRRAVALHHIDAPWRPADLEQRDGRIIRQGNLNMDTGVEVIRYVTEGSFDAYMWQTLERKARFIHQVMKGTLDVREIEDIGDTAADYAVTKAISTGNPDYYDKAVAEARLVDLESAHRAHTKGQNTNGADLALRRASQPILDGNVLDYQKAVEARAAFLAANPEEAEGFKITLAGSTIDNRPDAAAKVKELLLAVAQATQYGDGPDVPMGTFGGFAVNGRVRRMDGGGRRLELSFPDIPDRPMSIGLDELRESTGQGLITRMENAVQRLPRRLDEAVGLAADNRVQIESLATRQGPFPGLAELTAMRARLNRINMKIERDEARAKGEQIPFDPAIDTDQNDDPMVRSNMGNSILDPFGTPPPEGSTAAAVTGRPAEVSAVSLSDGDRIVVVADPETGRTAIGEVVSTAMEGGFLMVTVNIPGEGEVVRAMLPDTTVERFGPVPAEAGVKTLAIIGGKVQAVPSYVARQVKKFAARWNEELHPRDRHGRFIEVNATVSIWGGGTGTILNMEKGGRVRVQRSDGKVVVVDSGNVTVTKTPEGQTVGQETPETPEVPSTGSPATPAAPEAPETPEASGSGRTPAPGKSPEDRGTLATFTGEDGTLAWLGTGEDGEPVGYIQRTGEEPEQFDSPDAWAQAVDDEGMTSDTDSGTAEEVVDSPDVDDMPGTARGQQGAPEEPEDAPEAPEEPEQPEESSPEVRAETAALAKEVYEADPDADLTGGGDTIGRVFADLMEGRGGDETTRRNALEDIAERIRTEETDGGGGGFSDETRPLIPRMKEVLAAEGITVAPQDAPETPAAAPEPGKTPNPDYDPDARAGTSESFEFIEDDDLNYPTSSAGAPAAADAPGSQDPEDIRRQAASMAAGIAGGGDPMDPASQQRASFTAEALAALGEQAARDLDTLEAMHGNPGRPDGAGTIEDPIDVQGDIELATRLLSEGKHIRLNRLDDIGTLVDKLNAVVEEAKAKGESAPEFDLCNVSVPGTNLFCAQSKGIPRALMPQLSGIPREGSRAADLPRNARGTVDVTDAYLAELAARGVAVERVDVPATWLKATQAQLDGPKVAGITRAMAAGKVPDATIFVTRDGYVIDGHHRWAAKVNNDAADGKLGDTMQPVMMLDMEIGEALDFANAFAADIGIQSKGTGANAEAAGARELAPLPSADADLSARTDQQLAHALVTADDAGRKRVHAELTRRAAVLAEQKRADAEAHEAEMTAMLQEMVGDFNGRLEGLDFRLKETPSMTRKIRDKALEGNQPQQQAADAIGDALRYTIVLDTDTYADGMQQAIDRWAEQGFQVQKAGNMWVEGNNYKGMNLTLVNAEGFLVEVQTHTPESLAAKEANHGDYEVSRDLTQPMDERQAAHFRMVEVQNSVPIPPGAEVFGERWITNQPLYSPPDKLPAPPVPGSEGYAAAQATEAARADDSQGATATA